MPESWTVEIEPEAHGAWRRRQLARECLRVCYATGERLLDVKWAFMRPIMSDVSGPVSREGLRNLARIWGLEL